MYKRKNKEGVICLEVIVGFIFMSAYFSVCTYLLLYRTPMELYATSARALGALVFAVTLYFAAVVVIISDCATPTDTGAPDAAESERVTKHVLRLAYLSVSVAAAASAYQSYVLLNYFSEIGYTHMPYVVAVIATCTTIGLFYGVFRVLCPTKAKLVLACELRV